jgi:Tol biopolymer transport system component
VVFTRDIDLYEKASNGQGEEKILYKSDVQKVACDWSRDGKSLLFMARGKDTGFDLWVLSTGGGSAPTPYLKTPANELAGAFSPDGRFVAYHSNESGRNEVYVQTFPTVGGKWQISSAGGVEPHWRADGKELYYRSLDQRLMAVDIGSQNGFQAGVPKPLFTGRFETGIARAKYLPTPDGQKFFIVGVLGRESISPTTVVLNWFADLGR